MIFEGTPAVTIWRKERVSHYWHSGKGWEMFQRSRSGPLQHAGPRQPVRDVRVKLENGLKFGKKFS